ncbi:FKBP-type peptidyl-prolyl cis-trans isomerase [Hymenobacter sediminicola]|uniref:Peptidyl-prolyl cis-trans isomerase n=1 Tax=Hymenobacter sediminicola TaxID=2761579 RepID=A0A7G7W2Q4_9BACT|nr:FKBP-type peptidyl-prolyl cis-trans isomerase [Hymenobacter sediminicola]QNH60647.1 FKBP-type peptidyl-prolyl cis-trans isomerase [Hymenobacter sediminicola]
MLYSHSSIKRLTGGLLSFLTPLLLVSCGGNSIDIDALNAQALQRQKQVLRADSVAIAKYIADSSFVNVRRQPSGVCIVTKVAGTGDLPRNGQTASVVYKGMLLTNQVFDQSRLGPDGRPVPFIFTLGANQVIPGWEEGIGLMRKGEKAILLIPSAWAYGPSGAGNLIPPDSPLRFDVELTNLQ